MVFQEFLNKYSSAAFRAEEETGIDYRVVLAQWCLESGMGRNDLSVNHNNPASIRFTGRYGTKGPGGFASYSSPAEFIEDYIRVMSLEYYRKVREAGSAWEQIAQLQASPYDVAHYPQLPKTYREHFESSG